MNYNPFSLNSKTILITGASSGIGQAIAIECSKMGATVVITGRNKERLNETFTTLEAGEHQQIIADLSDEDQLVTLVTKLPQLNGVVNCAGISGHLPFNFMTEMYLREMFEVNFFAGVTLMNKILRAKKINKDSSIIFMTSTSGVISSYIGGSAYSATKGALSGLIKGMALDLAPKRIRVNSIMPAMVSTPIMNNGSIDQEQFDADVQRYPLKRYGKPEEVAYAAIYLLSDASLWTTGTNLLLDGGRTINY
ncbi:MAG: SDR family oxidoreductase [Alistipes sp.]